jgi:hypothetical protein
MHLMLPICHVWLSCTHLMRCLLHVPSEVMMIMMSGVLGMHKHASEAGGPGRVSRHVKSHVATSEPSRVESGSGTAGHVATSEPSRDPFVSDDIGALRSWNKVPCPITHQGPVLILHSRVPLGSARAAWMKDGIGDGVRDVVVAARMSRSSSTWKPSFACVTIR